MLLQRVAACNEETAKRNLQLHKERSRYRSTKPDHKALLSRSIVEVVHVDVREVKALPEISQALREGATEKTSLRIQTLMHPCQALLTMSKGRRHLGRNRFTTKACVGHCKHCHIGESRKEIAGRCFVAVENSNDCNDCKVFGASNCAS